MKNPDNNTPHFFFTFWILHSLLYYRYQEPVEEEGPIILVSLRGEFSLLIWPFMENSPKKQRKRTLPSTLPSHDTAAICLGKVAAVFLFVGSFL